MNIYVNAILLPIIFVEFLQTFSNGMALYCNAAPMEDLVTSLPGFDGVDFTQLPYQIYSGYIIVQGPFQFNDYDSLEIHYQLHTSSSSSSPQSMSSTTVDNNDPVVTWHQGGPGGSSINVGLYTEMGVLQIDSNGPYMNNRYAWNTVANMLYLESPAGSDYFTGSSACMKDNIDVPCVWDDISQAELYTYTLASFFSEKFPELVTNELYLTGESYFGQYGPNIANYILSNNNYIAERFSLSLNLKGMALGNACWGGNETKVMCNGPNSEQNHLDTYYGKGLIPKKLYKHVYKICNFPVATTSSSTAAAKDNFIIPPTSSYKRNLSEICHKKLEEVSKIVGIHNPYNIYDNCPDTDTQNLIKTANKTPRWYETQLIGHLPMAFDHNGSLKEIHFLNNTIINENNNSIVDTSERKMLLRDYNNNKNHHRHNHAKDGGYKWSCGGIDATGSWILQDSVREALHLKENNRSNFSYKASGPASITLYPNLIKKLRILIYSGDSDNAVPYKGSEEWIEYFESIGIIKEKASWRPWFVTEEEDANSSSLSSPLPAPAGYVTSYSVVDAEYDDIDFHFLTIRFAGHMVPTFQPGPSLHFIKRFLSSESY